MTAKRLRKNVLTLQESLRHYGAPTAILFMGALLSIFGFFLVLKDQLWDIEKEFQTYAALEVSSLRHQFTNYQRGLELVQRFFQASELVTEEEFKTFVSPLFGYGGFEAFWWVPATTTEDYTVRYNADDMHHFAETQTISQQNYPQIYAALQKSTSLLAPVTSTPFTLEENEESHRVAITYPVMKNGQMIGSVIGILDFVQVLKRSLVWTREKATANIYLYNYPAGEKKQLVYAVKNEIRHMHDNEYDVLIKFSPFHAKTKILLPSDEWELLFVPTRVYMAKANSVLAWLILVCGLVISGLVGLFTFTQVSRGLQVRQQVDIQTREMRSLTKSLSESENKFRAIVDNTIDGLITFSESGAIKSFNPACERIFGYDIEEVLDKNIGQLMTEPYRSEYEHYSQQMQRLGKAKLVGSSREVKGKKKDGTVFPMELSISEVQLRDRKIYSAIVRDISDRKQSESQLQKTADALAESNRELEQFAYVASHDLKAPLRGIDNLSKWLMEDLGDSLKGENKENLQLLRGRVARMEKLLDDLLEYSRLPSRRRKKQADRVNGWDMLQTVLSSLTIPAGFTIEVSEDFKRIEVRDMPLQQVFFNLISNAIKHHDKPKGHIEIAFEDEIDHYHFRVSDDGPGIPRQFHHKVFQMFQTLKPRDEVEGSGIGLALVEKIIMQQGEEITLVSDTGIGATFLFTWAKE